MTTQTLDRHLNLMIFVTGISILFGAGVMAFLSSYFEHDGFGFLNSENWSYTFLKFFIAMMVFVILQRFCRSYENRHDESQMVKLNRLAFKGNIAILVGLFLVVISHLLV